MPIKEAKSAHLNSKKVSINQFIIINYRFIKILENIIMNKNISKKSNKAVKILTCKKIKG